MIDFIFGTVLGGIVGSFLNKIIKPYLKSELDRRFESLYPLVEPHLASIYGDLEKNLVNIFLSGGDFKTELIKKIKSATNCYEEDAKIIAEKLIQPKNDYSFDIEIASQKLAQYQTDKEV